MVNVLVSCSMAQLEMGGHKIFLCVIIFEISIHIYFLIYLLQLISVEGERGTGGLRERDSIDEKSWLSTKLFSFDIISI